MTTRTHENNLFRRFPPYSLFRNKLRLFKIYKGKKTKVILKGIGGRIIKEWNFPKK